MGIRTRHFCALMKKNWIIWKRTLGASICELFCPVVLMAIMAIARALIDQTVHEPSSNMGKSILMAPLPPFLQQTPNVTTAYNSSFLLSQTIAQLNQQYADLANFTSTDLLQKNPFTSFFPKHCMASRQDNSYPIVGYAGPTKYIEPLKRDLSTLCNNPRILTLLHFSCTLEADFCCAQGK